MVHNRRVTQVVINGGRHSQAPYLQFDLLHLFCRRESWPEAKLRPVRIRLHPLRHEYIMLAYGRHVNLVLASNVCLINFHLHARSQLHVRHGYARSDNVSTKRGSVVMLRLSPTFMFLDWLVHFL